MIQHVHTWTLTNAALRRYRCECGVVGHASRRGVVAYACQHELANRKHCGADAVHVTGERIKTRCAEHAPAKSFPLRSASAG